MKPKDNESLESWIERSRLYEQGLAMQKLALGQNPELVLEEFSRRLMEKILHPMYKTIQTSAMKNYDSEQDKLNYEENYIKKFQPVADHMDDFIIDKSDLK